jgi:single-stranded DNA-binding protein
MKLSDLWRHRAEEIRTRLSGGIGNEPEWLEVKTWEKAADELEKYHGRRLKTRSRYKRRETWPET